MKYYLFLLLLVFIACDVKKKTNEIVLKDFPYDFLEKFANIIDECGMEDGDCISENIADLFYDLTPDQMMEFQNFLSSEECQDDCVDIFSDVIKDDSVTEEFCKFDICIM